MNHVEVRSFALNHLKDAYPNQYTSDDEYMQHCRIIYTDTDMYLKFAIELYDVKESLKHYISATRLLKHTFQDDTYSELLKHSIVNAIVRDNFYMTHPSREIMSNVIRQDNQVIQFVCYDKNGSTHITKIVYDETNDDLIINTLH